MNIVNIGLLVFNIYLVLLCNTFYKQKLNHTNIFSLIWFFVLAGAFFSPFKEVKLDEFTFYISLLS